MAEAEIYSFFNGEQLPTTRILESLSGMSPEEESIVLDALVANLQILDPTVDSEPANTFRGRQQRRDNDRRQIFGDIVELTYEQVYAMVYPICGNAAIAEEVSQEAYLKAWKSFPNFEGRSAFTTWLCRIALNTAITHKDKSMRVTHKMISWLPHREGSAHSPESSEVVDARSDNDLQRVEVHSALKDALQTLRPKTRAIVVLHAIDGYPHATIAEHLDLSETAVKIRYIRGLRKLRDQLGPDFKP